MPTFTELMKAGILAVGDGYRAKNDELVGGGPIFLRSAYLQDTGWVLSDPDRLASGRNDFGTKVARLGDTVVTTKGNSLGRLGFVDADVAGAVYSPHLSYWRSLDHNVIDPRFLYYWSNSTDCLDQVRAKSHSTDMAPYLSLADQGSIVLNLPAIHQQRRTSKILGVLDDKIMLNRRLIKTLEALARTLFQSWIVNFDPVRLAASGKAQCVPDTIAGCFPTRLAENGIPDGWTLTPLSAMATFLNGLALQKFPARDGEPSLPVIRIAEMRVGPKLNSGRVTVALPSPKYIVNDGDHLFSWSGSLTQCLWSWGPAALNQHLFKVIPTTAPGWMCYWAVDHFLPAFQAIASGKAVTMGHIQRHHLDEALLPTPQKPLLQAIGGFMEPLFQRIKSLAVQNRYLGEIRDTLQPKLIAGETRIDDWIEVKASI